MNEKIMSIKEIAEIANIKSDTLRGYLARFTFNKYAKYEKIKNYRQLCYTVNKDFIKDLCDFLELKQRYDCIKLLKDYMKGNKKVTRYLFEENADLIEENKQLKQQLEMVCKQYNSLLNHHNECLKAFKKDIKNNEIIKE